jgi:hypothetical protein
MPFFLLILFLADLLAITVIIFDVHFIREWYLWKGTIEEDYARRCLYCAIGLAAFSFLGKCHRRWFSNDLQNNSVPELVFVAENDKLTKPVAASTSKKIFLMQACTG